LTSEQQQQGRTLLEEHRDKIQALIDQNPKPSGVFIARAKLFEFVMCLD
jgi:hypothetical protein